jgi:hypothetical protein
MLIGLCGQAGAGKSTVADFLVKNHGFVAVALADPLKRIAREVFDFSDTQLWGPSEARNKPDERYLRRPMQNAWTCTKCCHRLFGEKFEEMTIGRVLADRDCALCTKRMAKHNMHYVKLPAEFLTPRHALQQLGTEWGRGCYDNVWVDYALRVAADLLRNVTRYSAKNGALSGGTNINERVPQGVVISDVRFINEVDAIRAAGGHVWKIERPGAGLTGAAALHASEQEQNSIDQRKFASVLNNADGLEELEALVSKELSALQFIYPDQE